MSKIIERDIEATVGEVLHNANGTSYTVVQSTNLSGETTVVSRSRFPWVCVAHDIARLDDGTIEWSHSTQVGFLKDLRLYVQNAIDSKSCFIDCSNNWDDECFHRDGDLVLDWMPWWEQDENDPSGWVCFSDREHRMWATDGQNIRFFN